MAVWHILHSAFDATNEPMMSRPIYVKCIYIGLANIWTQTNEDIFADMVMNGGICTISSIYMPMMKYEPAL